MKLEEAMVYALANANRGMRTEQLAAVINDRKLHIRKDGKPVTGKQVFAVAMAHPEMFVKSDGLIRLMI